jgi:hypothetical protein
MGTPGRGVWVSVRRPAANVETQAITRWCCHTREPAAGSAGRDDTLRAHFDDVTGPIPLVNDLNRLVLG